MGQVKFQNSDNGLTLRDYVYILFQQKAVIITCMLAVCVTVFLGLKFQTRQYEARVKMLITAEKQVEAPYYKEFYAVQDIEQTLTQSEIVKSNPILTRVVLAQALHMRPPEDEKKYASALKGKLIDFMARRFNQKLEVLSEQQRNAYLFRRAMVTLSESIKVEPVRDTNMFIISVRDYDPVGAAILANVVSRSYVIYDLEQQLAELNIKYGEKHPKIVQLNDNIIRMLQGLDGGPMTDIEAMGPASVKIIEQASIPMEPAGLPKALIFILAAFMSVFFGVMLAFVFEYSNQTLRLPRDIELAAGVRCVGSIKRKRLFEKPVITFKDKLTSYGRAYQAVLDQIYLLLKEKNASSIVVASTLGVEKSPVMIANLANYVTAMLKHKVLIIDANLRNPSLQRIYGIQAVDGKTLADYLEGKAAIEGIKQHVSEFLSVIPAGRTSLNPVYLLDSRNMKQLMEDVKREYDLVIVCSAPIQSHNDGAILGAMVDSVILVVEEGQVRKQVIKTALVNLEGKVKEIAGAVLTNRTYPIPRFIYERV